MDRVNYDELVTWFLSGYWPATEGFDLLRCLRNFNLSKLSYINEHHNPESGFCR